MGFGLGSGIKIGDWNGGFGLALAIGIGDRRFGLAIGDSDWYWD